MSQLDVENAKKALAGRLRTWGIQTADPYRLASGFIDDLVDQGWKIAAHRETRPMPPKRHEACLTCGYHLNACICGEHRTRPVEANEATTSAGIAACREALGRIREGA